MADQCPRPTWAVSLRWLRGFEMQTEAGGAKWLPVQPSVGSSSLDFPNPSSGDMVTAIRYAQSDWPLVTLYTKEGQPAAPSRSRRSILWGRTKIKV